MEWQPIGTAPRDGTKILIWEGSEREITTAYWRIWEQNPTFSSWELSVCGYNAEDGDCSPTHWMPLPEAPKGAI